MKGNIKRILLVSLMLIALSCSMAFAAEAGNAEEFAVAWENAESGDTITLTGDIAIDTNYTLEGKEITLNLNGYTIDRGLDGVFSERADDGNIFTLEDGATLNIDGGYLRAGRSDDIGGCIHMGDDTTLNMNGGGINDCSTNDHGGAIRVDGDGVVINLNNVSFNYNSTFDSTDNSHGGVIYAENDCQLNCSNCSFYSNQAEDCGGAVYLEDDSYAVFSNCSFLDNWAYEEGGAVFQGSDSVAIFEDCDFNGNDSYTDGGALYIDTGEETRISNCTFNDNAAEQNGSAIYVNGEENYIADSKFRNNRAGGHGAVFVENDESVTLMGQVIIKNNQNGNLFLQYQSALFSRDYAEIHDDGLTGESYIGVYCEDVMMEIEGISEEQRQYFHTDQEKHPLRWSDDEPESTASVFSDSTGLIVIGGVVIVAAVVAIVIIKKKKTA